MLFQQPYWGAFGWKGDVPFPHGKTAEGYPWIGAENPKLVLNEFTDYACPHCKVASTQTLKSLAAHPKEGLAGALLAARRAAQGDPTREATAAAFLALGV